MTERLEGHFSVEESARTVRQYRYAVERMMRILAGWIALTPELSAKLLLGRHVWDNAQHADGWGRRLPELRAQAHMSEPSSQAFVAFMDLLESAEMPHQTVERLVGVYRVLKPHLLAVYEAHVAQANPVYEPPTRRILLRCIEDERRHIVAGETVLRHLFSTPALEERAAEWRARLEERLVAAGGVTGAGMPPAVALPDPAAAELSDDAREFIRLESVGREWPMPDDLRSALAALGKALMAGDDAGIRRGLLPECAWDPAHAVRLAGAGFESHAVVAFSKLGHHRLAKLRLEGPQGAVTLISRWVRAEGGWRASVLELAAFELAQPA
ncbi:MAG TPA: hypothetical protein VFO18_14340 [Methylomirabilota bacterium]|nr:hypothetical protein [Methylomirabilota bacterium]